MARKYEVEATIRFAVNFPDGMTKETLQELLPKVLECGVDWLHVISVESMTSKAIDAQGLILPGARIDHLV